VKEPVDLVLVGRNQSKLNQIAQDLKVRCPQSTIVSRIIKFEDPTAIEMLVSDLCSTPVDVALIAHGSLPDQQECQNNLILNKQTLEINGVSPALFAEAFAKHMEGYNKGTLAIIGSVAGDRGRKSNYVYGAAKGLITRYTQGLQHRLAKTKVKVVLIKPGPTDTPMTSHLKGKSGHMSSPEAVASCIVHGIYKGSDTIYAPRKWWLIMRVVQHMPKIIINKMDI
jgi:short-subunit dehydrogenase